AVWAGSHALRRWAAPRRGGTHRRGGLTQDVSAVELRLGENRRRLLQDLVGPPQLEVLPLELLEPLPLLSCQAGPPALVPLGLAHPLPERLRCTADLLGDRGDRRPLRIVSGLVLHDHPHSPLTHFR